MDRPIDDRVLRRRKLIRGAVSAGALGALVLALLGFRWLVTPELDRGRLRWAVAETGPIEATVAASGTVVPSIEEVVSSPIASRVVAVHRRPGDTVEAGDLILELDSGQSRLALSRTEEKIALKRNERRTRELSMRDRLNELEGQLELKSVDLESQQARRQRLEGLAQHQLVSDEELLENRLEIRRTEIEIRQKQHAIENLRETGAAELEKIALEMQLLEQQRAEERRTLDRASARAPRAGVVTSVINAEGTSVGVGEPLARVADLSAYRVDAKLSDAYASRLSAGQPARVKVGDQILAGHLETILPEIVDGTIRLRIALDDPTHQGLRANLRAETYLVTERRDSAVTVPRGPAINGSGLQTVFVIEGDRAERREVEVGMSSFDRWEIVKGIVAGETVILSDMSDHRHMSSIEID